PMESLVLRTATTSPVWRGASVASQAYVQLTLYGGEPTLWPRRSFAIFLEAVEEIRGRGLRLIVSLQTNAHRYDLQLLDLFAQHQVTMGVNLDEPKTANDRVRVLHSGHGTHGRVIL